MTRTGVRRVALAALAMGCLTAGCAPAATQRCHRYDALSLSPENGFAAALEWPTDRIIDAPPERVAIALTVVRPLRGPIEVVHVLGDVESDRWVLTLPDQGNVPSGVCWITPPGGTPNCGAVLRDLPYFPGGYYYLRANGNTVMEAGIAFYVCR
jgi:hypothetical protein